MYKAIMLKENKPSRRAHRTTKENNKNMHNSSFNASTNCKNSPEQRQDCASPPHGCSTLTTATDSTTAERNYRRNIRARADGHLKNILGRISWESIGPYIALDCEMVGIGLNGSQSALARVSMVNWEGAIILDTFVKVKVPVTDFRTFVSGVTAQDIESEDAVDFDVCRHLVQTILNGRVLIGHALVNDLSALMINHPWYYTRDTATYTPFMQLRMSRESNLGHEMKARKLRDLAWDKLGICIQQMGNAHSSVEDAIVALELYKLARNEWETLVSWQVKKASEAAYVKSDNVYASQQHSSQAQVTHSHSKHATSSPQNSKDQDNMMPTRMCQNSTQNETVNTHPTKTTLSVTNRKKQGNRFRKNYSRIQPQTAPRRELAVVS
mmetsp:Transcript_39510/g.58050  ORF Transcript_39510/g.58050 Transcript_39510/m.58050 type:complete len:382 (+) Transcript_39510:107-1252(+)|eukprot:CAMPEP_0195509462 /NCGR_PEP_ID=MMETSP0794_2-20130614/2393_1 /TAXON_ID=515487 /ORGANISM="Stephanopyxis turris, Strain CCMP 815" /LENGTH=381 /DNA_ID=CAMNT_0040636687 /DNA_START=101 /DNA_END=1246 /DNA_ORIENTATION=-